MVLAAFLLALAAACAKNEGVAVFQALEASVERVILVSIVSFREPSHLVLKVSVNHHSFALSAARNLPQELAALELSL